MSLWSKLRIPGLVGFHATRVLLRRLRRQSLNRTWGIQFEASRELLRSQMERFGREDAARVRADLAALEALGPGSPGGVTRTALDAGPVQGEWHRPAADLTRTMLFLHGGGYVFAGAPGEWHRPAADLTRTMLFLHGGGYVFGGPPAVGAVCGRLAAEAQARVFALKYRLAPEHPFPAAVEDSVACVKWLYEDQGVQPEELVVGGDSAGGGLTAATLIRLEAAGLPLPAGAILISPWMSQRPEDTPAWPAHDVDVLAVPMFDVFSRHYRADTPTDDPAVSPLLADMSNWPPVLVQVGALEILLEQAERTVEKLKGAGVAVELDSYPEMIHAWQYFLGLPAADRALARAAAFVREHAAQATPTA